MSDHPPSPESPAESLPPGSDPKVKTAISTLASILPTTTQIPATIPDLLSSSSSVFSSISSLLRLPDSGSGDNNLCRWLYDTFQSAHPLLQLLVLRFVPTIAGLYLSRVHLRSSQAGFEAVLLALYAHETTARDGASLTVNIPDISYPSVYHESPRVGTKANSTCLHMTVISPSLEPHGTVRATRRARIVGVALELYISKISMMPRESKLDFCGFCETWAGQNENNIKIEGECGNDNGNDDGKEEDGSKEGRIPLPWELLQPVLRILGHCIFICSNDKELMEAATSACRSLYLRSLHEINPKMILATRSLVRLQELAMDPNNSVDYTEVPNNPVISL